MRRGAGRGALGLYARSEWRARWRSQLLLSGTIALAVTAVVASLVAATRSETAFRRLRVASHASDISAFFPNARRAEAAAATIARLDGVDRAAAQAELFVRPKGTDYFPDYNLYADAPLATRSALNVPVVTTGRPVDPRRPDEMVMSEGLAAKLKVSVGATVPLESMTTRWNEIANTGGDPGPPDGPTVKVVVVGLSRAPADFSRWAGLLHLSPAFVERYGSRLRTYASVEVRLSRPSGRRAVLRRVRTLSRDVQTHSRVYGDDASTDDGLNAIAITLRIVATVAALAGAVVTAFALARATRAGLADHRTLVALGWTSRQLVLAVLVVFAPWLLLGVGIGIGAGVLASPEVVVGLARRVDPVPGSVVVDSPVMLVVGLVAVVFGCLVLGVVSRRVASVRPVRPPRPIRLVGLARPLALILGARQALGGEVDRGGRSSRGAGVVMAAGLAGAVAALMVSASISRLETDPSLIGQGTGRVIDSGESVAVYDRALPRLERDTRVAMLAGLHIVFGVSAGRRAESTMLAYDIKRGDLGISVVRGRVARRADEVTLGPATLDQLGKKVGDRIVLRHEKATARYRIVGTVLFPEGDFDHDRGVALTTNAANRLVGDVHDVGSLHQVAFDWADGVHARTADRGLTASGLEVLTNDRALKPASVTNLGQVTMLPRYLALLLGVLSLATLGHALSASGRRRSKEIATLRALGMRPRTSGAVVAWHAATLLGVAIVVGVPVGYVVGARIWTPIAEAANVVVETVAPGSAIAMYVLAFVVGAGFLTLIPASRARRMEAAQTLRAE